MLQTYRLNNQKLIRLSIRPKNPFDQTKDQFGRLGISPIYYAHHILPY